MSTHSIHGFQTNLTDSYFVLQPSCEIQVAMVSKQRLQQLALATNELRALDRITSVNSAAITEQQFHQLVALTRPQHQDPIQAELIAVSYTHLTLPTSR